MSKMNNRIVLSLFVGVAFTAGCATTSRTGPIETASVPGAPVTYKMVGKVESVGTASVFCPILPGGMDTAVRQASEIAVGNAIYERDDIDAVLNPKRKVVATNFIVFGTAEVTLKGQGAAIQK